MNYKYSIIIPMYNSALYIGACINSILKQTYSNFECIIIDDCSTDASINVTTELIRSDNRFKLVKKDKNTELNKLLACVNNIKKMNYLLK